MTAALLFPLALLGGLAIAVPIWLHLRKEEHADLIEFSAMQFLDDSPVARSRPVRIRNWLLLLLRILALLLLVMAFSWPYLPAEQPAVIRESRVYILDNTLSQQADSRFEKARERVVDELRSAGPETQIAVIELTSSAEPIVRFGDSPSEMATTVAQLQPSAQRGSYLEAFRLAQQLLDQSLGSEHTIVFLGDSQENQWTEGLNVPPFLGNVAIQLPELDDQPLTNLWLSEPRVQRLMLGTQVVAQCSVQLSRLGDLEEVNVVFKEDGRPVSSQQLKLPADTESLLLTANWPTDPERWLRGEIVLEGNRDTLPVDDRVFFSLPPIRQGKVELFSDSVFLQTALSPEVMSGRWQIITPPRDPLGRKPANARQVPDVVLVESHFLRDEAVRERVRQSLQQGAGVILLMDEVSPVIAGFVRELGIECEPGADIQHPSPSTFRYVFEDHPVFADFRSSDFGNLVEINVNRYRRFTMSDGLPLAFSQSGHPLIQEGNVAGGRILVFAFSMVSEDTNWPVSPTFVPFLDRCLRQLRQEPDVETRYQPGESCVWSLPSGRDIQRVRLHASQSPAAEAPLEAEVGNGQARFRVPNEPGHYELRYNSEDEIVQILDVNPAAAESELTFAAEPPALELWKREEATKPSEREPEDAVIDLTTSEILKQNLWWWFLVAALMALAVETVWISLRRVQ